VKELEWDIIGISESLHANTELVQSPAEGQGIRFLVGLSQLTLEVWPQTGHARITTPDELIEAYRVRPASLGQGDLILEGGDKASARRYYWLDSSGQVHIYISPSSELGMPAERVLDAIINQHNAEEGETPSPTPLQEAQYKLTGPSGPVSQDGQSEAVSGAISSPNGQDAEAKEKKKEYIKLSGRVGRKPVFWTTRNGVAITKFPLGVHFEDGSTQWHTIKAWRALAERARELNKGQLASVNGYIDYETRKCEDGKIKREKIVRAAMISPK
jgi:hypothetical protein